MILSRRPHNVERHTDEWESFPPTEPGLMKMLEYRQVGMLGVLQTVARRWEIDCDLPQRCEALSLDETWGSPVRDDRQ